MLIDKNNVVTRQKIVIDQDRGDNWIVTGGLNDGSRIVVDGLQRIHPGSKVNATEASAPTN